MLVLGKIYMQVNKNSVIFYCRRVMGGLVITASGIAFGSGGEDNRMWAYDVDTGEELWHSDPMEHEVTSVPMTYRTGGRQFIVVNVGGHFSWPGRADIIYAFALKKESAVTKPVVPSSIIRRG